MKIAIIGAGSTYTPELVEGIIQRRATLPVDTLSLMDIDEEKLAVVGGLAKRMGEAAALPTEITLTGSLDEALAGADFVLAQVRVGRLPARVLDETIPLKYGLIGQETTGIGGFFKALRTIPVVLDIARAMERLCPNAWLINFSNPSGILAEALSRHSPVRSVGLCNVPINMAASLREGLDLSDAEVEFCGLNHLSWVTSIRANGREYLPRALELGLTGGQMANVAGAEVDYEVIRRVGAIPSSYLQYYYFRRQMLAHEQAAAQCRGQECMDIERNLLARYRQPELREKPPELAQRGGARYSEAAIALVNALYNKLREVHTVNLPNDGVVPYLNPADVVEVNALTGASGLIPISLKAPENLHIRGLVQPMKAFEKLTVEAALRGDDGAALNALLLHPLVGDWPAAKACYWELKEAHRPYLPAFFR